MNDLISFLAGLSLGGLLTLSIMFVVLEAYLNGMKDNNRL